VKDKGLLRARAPAPHVSIEDGLRFVNQALQLPQLSDED